MKWDDTINGLLAGSCRGWQDMIEHDIIHRKNEVCLPLCVLGGGSSVLTPWVDSGLQVWSQRTLWPPHTGRCKLGAESGPTGREKIAGKEGKCRPAHTQTAVYTGEVIQRLNIVFHERLGRKKKQLLHTILKATDGIRKAWIEFSAQSPASGFSYKRTCLCYYRPLFKQTIENKNQCQLQRKFTYCVSHLF